MMGFVTPAARSRGIGCGTVLFLLIAAPGCGKQRPAAPASDPIVGAWESGSEPRITWAFDPDGTGGPDLSRLEAQFRALRPGQPLSERARRFLDEQKAKRFTWRQEGPVYRMESPHFGVSPIFVRIQGNQLYPTTADGRPTTDGAIPWTRVR